MPESQISTDTPLIYLKSNAKIEPLFCGWLIWSHLLSPVQAAMNLAFRYLPLLQSFVVNPDVHIAATSDPKMFGGPFVHLTRKDVSQVKDLIANTKKRLPRLLLLADETKMFDSQIHQKAKGHSLNEFYSKVPSSLAGMVELMYDINSQPQIRFIEELVYAEYEHDLCSELMEISVSITPESERRFFMSTPRLESPSNLSLKMALADPRIDCLADLRTSPRAFKDIETSLGLTQLSTRYGHLFTSKPPHAENSTYTSDNVRIRYFGHACVLIQTAEISILIDPMFAIDSNAESDRGGPNRFTIVDLPLSIDYVILTHSHQDHFCPEILLQIRSRVRKVVVPFNNRGSITDPSMKLALMHLGFTNILALGSFDSVTFNGGKFTGIPFPGEHADLDVYSKQSIFVEIKNRRLLFLVDSDGWQSSLYERIAKYVLGDSSSQIDALFLGMECHGAPMTWLYGPLLSKAISRRDDESRRLSGSDYSRAAQIVRQFKCNKVYVYAMGQEPWLRYVMGLEYAADSIQLKESNRLVDDCRSKGIDSHRLYGCQDIHI